MKAANVLPESLLREIQKYVQGETIYIPKPKQSHYKWGTRSGGREQIEERNRSIKAAFRSGARIETLADDYFLSPETVKKIVYSQK